MSGGCLMLQGFIMGQNTATYDTVAWNIALLVKRIAGSSMCQTVGDTTPSVFAQEGTTSACNVTLSADATTGVVSVIGLSGADVTFDVNLDFTLAD
jgi:hypothetical protein